MAVGDFAVEGAVWAEFGGAISAYPHISVISSLPSQEKSILVASVLLASQMDASKNRLILV